MVCLFRRATAVACPTCGLTRASALFLRGEWRAALTLHPALPLLIGELAVVALALAVNRRRRPGVASIPSWAAPLAVATAVGLVALWLVRLLTGSLPA